MRSKQLFLASLFFLLSACGSSGEVEQIPSESSTYMAAEIKHDLVQYIWLELPKHIEPGTQSVRVFIATTNPPRTMVSPPAGEREA